MSSTLLKRPVQKGLALLAMLVASSASGGPQDELTQRVLKLREAIQAGKGKAAKGQTKPSARSSGEAYCGGIKLRPRAGALPFSEGEELAYEITVAGVYVGRMETKVGKTRTVEGKKAISLFGRARTNAFASTFKKFAGRYMTLVDADTKTPFGMRVDSTYGEDPRWEKVRFYDDNHRVTGDFSYEGKEGTRSYEADEHLMDVLAMLYYARTLDMPIGHDSCHHVFGARWLWRMDAKVKGIDRVDTPAGRKEATVVTTTFHRAPHADLIPSQKDQKFEMDVYFARDPTQAPLQFVIRISDLTAVGKLVRWSLKDQGEDGWAF